MSLFSAGFRELHGGLGPRVLLLQGIGRRIHKLWKGKY